MRKLSGSEKRLLILLLAAILGAAYYYLFWVKINEKITAAQDEINLKQPIYNEYEAKINELPNLRAQLKAIKDLPSNKEKFYSAGEGQEVYMDFLHDLITNNDLMYDSISFSRARVELPVVTPPAPVAANMAGNPDGGAQTAAKAPSASRSASLETAGQSKPYLNVTTAVITFSVDFYKPENLLNALKTIETNEKMVVVDNLRLSIGKMSLPITEAAKKGASGTEAARLMKVYQCNAVISFVNLVFPAEGTPAPITQPDTEAAPGAPALPGPATEAPPTYDVFEVPVEAND